MPGWPILSLVTFLPLIGALFVLVVRGDDAVARRNMRWTALFTTVLVFVLSLDDSGSISTAACRGFSFSRNEPGSATFPAIAWASMAFPCRS